MLFFFIFRKKLICVNIYFSTASTQLSHVSYRKPSCLSETHIGIISKMSSNFVSVEKMAKISENQSKIVVRLLSTKPTDDETVDNSSIAFNKLPDDIIEQIVSNYKSLLLSKYVLRKWVKNEELDWSMLSENPCAIDLLKEKIEQEKSMDKEEYKNLSDDKKVNWLKLTINSEDIDILKKGFYVLILCFYCLFFIYF